MFAKTFTQKQIFSGLRIFWKEELGCDSTFNLDARIDRHLGDDRLGDLIGLKEEYDFADIISGLEEYFGFSCPLDEWERYFGWSPKSVEEWERIFAPRFTFRRLVDFIRERVEPIYLEPRTVLGIPCLTAGIFRGIEQLVRQISPKTTRFAPSTPILLCLQGLRLRAFWNRLRWMVEDQLPPPPQITLRSRGFLHSLFFKFAIGLLIAFWRRDLNGVLAGIATTFALLFPMGVIVAFINARLNPLPEGIETFGDLARVLAAIILDQQNEGASCSTP